MFDTSLCSEKHEMNAYQTAIETTVESEGENMFFVLSQVHLKTFHRNVFAL